MWIKKSSRIAVAEPNNMQYDADAVYVDDPSPSSTIFHLMKLDPSAKVVETETDKFTDAKNNEARHPFLLALGERLKKLRAQRGLTRKALAKEADVSERYLANLEYGIGNASVMVLLQISTALRASLAELLGDFTTTTPEWLMLRAELERCDEATLKNVRQHLSGLLGGTAQESAKDRRIALIGLRGAGKSSLGLMLSQELGFPFIELGRDIEALAGCPVHEIQGLYGMNAYRRYERRALEQAIAAHEEAVIATPGGLVSDTQSFNLLLSRCTTIWLQATPEDHMRRVREQGDLRPMAASKEAMEDLKSILEGRKAFYSKSDYSINTSGRPIESAFQELSGTVRKSLETR
jgi:XRE family transcriptional regulator, aerobic/anaerobic benzoate catabolism transcriptional regulator